MCDLATQGLGLSRLRAGLVVHGSGACPVILLPGASV